MILKRNHVILVITVHKGNTNLLSILILLTFGIAVLFPSFAAEQREPFALGADISWIQQREACGVRYFHNGQRVDPFEVLKDHGFNYIRLRIFVDPLAAVPGESESPYVTTNLARCPATANGAYCGADSTVRMAQRAKAAGMKVLLNFHYSDTWTDPGKQHRPMSWRSLTDAQVIAMVRQYTKESLEKFRDADALPDIVQVGNENSGRITGFNINSTNGAAVINAGIDGIRDVSPDIKTMVHTINERNPTGWLADLIRNGVAANRIDVFGLSFYLRYHGTHDSLQRVLNRFVSNPAFGSMKVSVVEYIANPPAADDPRTHHRRVNDIVFELPDNRGFGTFIWEPFDWTDENTGVTLFDWTGTGQNAGRHSNQYLLDFPIMAKDYSIPDDGKDDDPKDDDPKDDDTKDDDPKNVINKNIPSGANFSVNSRGIITYNSNTPGTVTVYNMNGRVMGRINVNSPGIYNPQQLLQTPLRSGVYIIAIEPHNGRKHTFKSRVTK